MCIMYIDLEMCRQICKCVHIFCSYSLLKSILLQELEIQTSHHLIFTLLSFAIPLLLQICKCVLRFVCKPQ